MTELFGTLVKEKPSSIIAGVVIWTPGPAMTDFFSRLVKEKPLSIIAGLSSGPLLRRASEESRLLVTFDKDFGDLAFRARMPVSHGIVLFRLANIPVDSVPQFVADSLASQVEWEGHFSVISERRIRMRAIPRGHR